MLGASLKAHMQVQAGGVAVRQRVSSAEACERTVHSQPGLSRLSESQLKSTLTYFPR